MSLFLANYHPRKEIDVITRITRKLSAEGEIKVQVGQEVTPDEIIGTSQVITGFRTLNLASLLSTSPQEARKYLQRPVGQKIYRGELLAYKKGGILGGKKMVISPTDGELISYDERSGLLRISFFPKKEDLPAAVFGIVEQIDKTGGKVVIRTQVTRVFTPLGSGISRDGTLTVLGGKEDLVDIAKIGPNLAEHIVVGGGLIYKDAIVNAISLGVNGIITGGINASDYLSISGGHLKSKATNTDIGVTILVTEGLGSIPIGLDLFDIFRKHHGKFALIDGNRCQLILPSFESGCMNKIKATKLPEESPVKSVEELEAIPIKVGQKVRVISASSIGEQGHIIAIDRKPTLLPSNISSVLVIVESRSRKLKVPYANIEIIEG